MKKILLVATAFAAMTMSAHAQSDYKSILKQTFDVFDTTHTDIAAKQSLANKLVLIAKKYPDQWAPQFYASYSRVQLSYSEQDAAKRDAILDEADNYLADAVHLLGKPTSETEVLGATIANSRMGVDPRNRWQKYGKQFDEHLEKAKELNADNPRIYLQRGIAKYFTPKMFGGGKSAAMPYFEKAQGLFAKEAGDNIEQPYWGKSTLAYFLQMANGDDKEESTK
jgi:hypothetical protein